ncbi:hypothetical protein ACS0TY_003980 [Phlomoides rotata]
MGKHSIIVSLLFTLTLLAHSDGFPNHHLGAQKVTYLQVYVQDILSGPDPTNIVVASPTSTPPPPNFFGVVAAIDDPVRVSPNPNATIVGRAQGIFNFASLEEPRLHMSFDIVFTDGQHNGSILNVIGNNPYLRERRELAVVGGSGAFKLARGFIGVRTVSFNASTGDAFFQYNVTVFHH